MSAKLKKALIVALAAFLTTLTGYAVAPGALEALCVKFGVCQLENVGPSAP